MASKVGPTFWPLLWEAFIRAWGVPAVIISLIAGILVWKFAPTSTVELFWVVVLAIIAIILIATLLNAYYLAHVSLAPVLPKALSGRGPHQPYTECYALVILEPSELFGNDTSVSFYIIQDDGYEQLLGAGRVVNKQVDGRLQVILEVTYPDLAKEVTGIQANNAASLKRLLVRPQVNRAGFELFLPRSKKQAVSVPGGAYGDSGSGESEDSASDESEPKHA